MESGPFRKSRLEEHLLNQLETAIQPSLDSIQSLIETSKGTLGTIQAPFTLNKLSELDKLIGHMSHQQESWRFYLRLEQDIHEACQKFTDSINERYQHAKLNQTLDQVLFPGEVGSRPESEPDSINTDQKQSDTVIETFQGERYLVQRTNQALYETGIEELDLRTGVSNTLKRRNITRIGQVLSMNEDDLLSIRDFGVKSLEHLLYKLKVKGLIKPTS